MNNTKSVDVIACVAPRAIPVRQSACAGRSEIERWKEIVIRQTINFFCFNPPSSSKVSPTFSANSSLISFPYCFLVQPKSILKKNSKNPFTKAVVSSHSCVCPDILFPRALRVNWMHLVAEKSHKAVTTPSFKSHRKKCLPRPSQLRKFLLRFRMPLLSRPRLRRPTTPLRRLWRPLPLLPSMLVNWILPLLRLCCSKFSI